MKDIAASMPLAEPLPGGLGGTIDRFSGLGAGRLARRGHQLAQDLGHLRRGSDGGGELRQGGIERPAERGREGEAREPGLQCRDPLAHRPISQGRVEQQVERHAHGEPEREDTLAPRPPVQGREKLEQVDLGAGSSSDELLHRGGDRARIDLPQAAMVAQRTARAPCRLQGRQARSRSSTRARAR